MECPAYQVHGIPGRDGRDGRDGAKGDQGMPVNTGPQGPPGPTGANGAKRSNRKVVMYFQRRILNFSLEPVPYYNLTTANDGTSLSTAQCSAPLAIDGIV